MKKEAVIKFLQAIGAQNIKETAEWINCSCPLARWKHEKKTDRHPSAGISISDTSMSTWLCYTCTPSAKPTESLLGAIWVTSGSYPYEASKILSEEEIFDDETYEKQIEVRTFDIWQDWVKPKQQDVLPRPVIDAFPLLSDLDTKLATEAKRWLFQERNINDLIVWLNKFPDCQPKQAAKPIRDSGFIPSFHSIPKWTKDLLEAGIDSERNNTWFKVAAVFADRGFEEDETVQILEQFYAEDRDFKRKEWLITIKSAFKCVVGA